MACVGRASRLGLPALLGLLAGCNGPGQAGPASHIREATGFSIQEAHAVVLDPTHLNVIVARVAPAAWGAIALARQP